MYRVLSIRHWPIIEAATILLTESDYFQTESQWSINQTLDDRTAVG
jgi:hypothetical protein